MDRSAWHRGNPAIKLDHLQYPDSPLPWISSRTCPVGYTKWVLTLSTLFTALWNASQQFSSMFPDHSLYSRVVHIRVRSDIGLNFALQETAVTNCCRDFVIAYRRPHISHLRAFILNLRAVCSFPSVPPSGRCLRRFQQLGGSRRAAWRNSNIGLPSATRRVKQLGGSRRAAMQEQQQSYAIRSEKSDMF